MPNKLSRGTRIYIRRRKAEIRRESDNPLAALNALKRQFPQPTLAGTVSEPPVAEPQA